MSLKITNAGGFLIDGVLNTDVTVIYVRLLPNMANQAFVPKQGLEEGEQPTDEHEDRISIQTPIKTTLNGGLFDDPIQIKGVPPVYWTMYKAASVSIDQRYQDIEEYFKEILIQKNPSWAGKIEIVTLGVNQAT